MGIDTLPRQSPAPHGFLARSTGDTRSAGVATSEHVMIRQSLRTRNMNNDQPKRLWGSLGTDERSEAIFEICSMFVSGATADEIKNEIKKKYGLVDFHREQVYPGLREGVHEGVIALRAPRNLILSRLLAAKFNANESCISVIAARGRTALDAVAACAADITHKLILLNWATEGPLTRRVHVALGAGNSTMLMAKHLAKALRVVAADSRPISQPKLCFHAMSSGFSPLAAMHAPIALFSLFDHPSIDATFVGLFTEPLVSAKQYKLVREDQNVRPAFDERDKVRIVVTSLSRRASTAGLLNECVKKYEATMRELDDAGWVGDVQFMPYSINQPIRVRRGMRAVTLFEIDELVKQVNHGRTSVVLMSGPEIGVADEDIGTRAEALLPLLTSPKLRVWSHLVLDAQTAEEVLKL